MLHVWHGVCVPAPAMTASAFPVAWEDGANSVRPGNATQSRFGLRNEVLGCPCSSESAPPHPTQIAALSRGFLTARVRCALNVCGFRRWNRSQIHRELWGSFGASPVCVVTSPAALGRVTQGPGTPERSGGSSPGPPELSAEPHALGAVTGSICLPEPAKGIFVRSRL